MREPIDFVVTWVDGSDPAWLADRAKYEAPSDADNSSERFRPMDTLRYWFRGVEAYCPWVRTVHFVTWGHVPTWLNLDAPKLHVVRHEDFIPHEYLPTFNSNAIELNLFRIPGLARHFVYFNDDMFILRPLEARDFFQDGLPVDMLAFQPVIANPQNPVMSHLYLNNSLLLARHFKKREIARNNPGALFHVGYPPLYFFYNALELLYPQMTGFYTSHQPATLLCETYETLWDRERDVLHATSCNRFRDVGDVSIYAFQEWQKLSGHFVPRNVTRRFAYYAIEGDLDSLIACVRGRRKAILCVNDGPCEDFEQRCASLSQALDEVLPAPSSFEVLP